jgi:hypothetical protein
MSVSIVSPSTPPRVCFPASNGIFSGVELLVFFRVVGVATFKDRALLKMQGIPQILQLPVIVHGRRPLLDQKADVRRILFRLIRCSKPGASRERVT